MMHDVDWGPDGERFAALFEEAEQGESFAQLGDLAHYLSRVIDEGWTPEPPPRANIVCQLLRALASACQLYEDEGPAHSDDVRRLIAGGGYNAAQAAMGFASQLAESLYPARPPEDENDLPLPELMRRWEQGLPVTIEDPEGDDDATA